MRALPDVTSDVNADTASTLQWVGMEEIAIPLLMKTQDDHVRAFSAKANAYVSLGNPNTKGIHISRVHLAINQLADLECDKANINNLLDQMVNSQAGISQQARVELSFDLLLSKPALAGSVATLNATNLMFCEDAARRIKNSLEQIEQPGILSLVLISIWHDYL